MVHTARDAVLAADRDNIARELDSSFPLTDMAGRRTGSWDEIIDDALRRIGGIDVVPDTSRVLVTEGYLDLDNVAADECEEGIGMFRVRVSAELACVVAADPRSLYAPDWMPVRDLLSCVEWHGPDVTDALAAAAIVHGSGLAHADACERDEAVARQRAEIERGIAAAERDVEAGRVVTSDEFLDSFVIGGVSAREALSSRRSACCSNEYAVMLAGERMARRDEMTERLAAWISDNL